MPLGLGLGLGIGSGAIYPPASSWPSVYDIPPGMLVLDADGVLKKKIKGFKNEGFDYLDTGRPSWIGALNPTESFTICTVLKIKKTAAIAQYLLGLLQGDDTPSQQVSVFFHQGAKNVSMVIGGLAANASYALPSVDTLLDICITSNGLKSDLWINGASLISGLTNGSFVTSQNLKIFGYAYNTAYNSEAIFFQSSIYSGYSSDGTKNGLSLIEKYDMDKWDGSTSGIGNNGTPYTIVKATPFTEETYALVPVSML